MAMYWINKMKKRSLLTVTIASLFILGACDLYEGTWVTQNRVQVQEDKFFEVYDLDDFNQSVIHEIAKDYDENGDGDFRITITYDPAGQAFTAQQATIAAEKIARMFIETAVKTAQTDIMPTPETPRKVLVSYDRYTAAAPLNCGTLPGFSGREGIERNDDYALGCTIETLMARQVARPSDLRGKDTVPPTYDGRRVANSGEAYRDGVPNEPLEGFSASGDE